MFTLYKSFSLFKQYSLNVIAIRIIVWRSNISSGRDERDKKVEVDSISVIYALCYHWLINEFLTLILAMRVEVFLLQWGQLNHFK